MAGRSEAQRPKFGLAQYEALAVILGDINAEGFHGQSISLTKLNEAFFRALAKDNPRFDRERFSEWLLRSRAEAFMALGSKE